MRLVFYREMKHRDQPLSTTLKKMLKAKKNFFRPIEIYSEKTMT